MYFDDRRVGMTVEIAPAPIEKQKMLDFARDHDNIPLHTDGECAKASPFGQCYGSSREMEGGGKQ